MPVPKDIEEELREFMREQREAEVGATLRHLTDTITAHDADDKVRHVELQGEIRGLSLRVGALEKNDEQLAKRDEKLEERLEKSGSWDREALQAQAITARDDANWWKRNWLSMLATIVAIGSAIAALAKK